MNKFSLSITISNLKNNPNDVTLEQLLVYVNDIIGSDLPFDEKVDFCRIIKESLTHTPRQVSQIDLIGRISQALSAYDYAKY